MSLQKTGTQSQIPELYNLNKIKTTTTKISIGNSRSKTETVYLSYKDEERFLLNLSGYLGAIHSVYEE